MFLNFLDITWRGFGGIPIFEFLNTEDFDVFQTMLDFKSSIFWRKTNFLEFRIDIRNGDL